MKYIKQYEERYLSDEEIISGYNKMKITYFKVDVLFKDGGASGSIEVEFGGGEESKFDNWIKYDSGPRIAFDHWYPTEVAQELKEYINKGIEEEILNRTANKYNI